MAHPGTQPSPPRTLLVFMCGCNSKFRTKEIYVSSHILRSMKLHRNWFGRSWNIRSLISADIYQLLQRKVLRFHSLHLIQRNLRSTIRSLHVEEDQMSTGSFTSLFFSNFYKWLFYSTVSFVHLTVSKFIHKLWKRSISL